MARLSWLAIGALALALAACSPPASTSTASATPTPTATERSPADIQAALAALPAPYSAADYEAGKHAFAQCRACHAIGSNRVGPDLAGLFGRTAGTEPGFTYSDAVKNAGFTWDADHLDHWLANPREFLPGNRMAFVGVRDEAQRRDLIAYLMIETKR
ncbi:MAG TPA: cytochrome c family protein [Caulobacterales bacterium]|nr:cytochrome c family protein [Caulobacterales bacterium]